MIRTKIHVLIFVTVAITGSLLYFYFDPAFNRFFPPCPFFALTGFYCPGCGSQRAVHDLLHGNFFQAADHNLLFMLFIPLMIFAAIVGLNNSFRRKKLTQGIFNSAVFSKIVLVLVLLFWGIRNIHIAPFDWLAP